MKISLCIPIENITLQNGYGQAGYHIVSSLQRLGHSVTFGDQTAQVELAFCQPTSWQWSSKDSYKIGYLPWESTKLPKIWKRMMTTADELWTTSPVVAKWFEAEGFPNVRVYQHGVDYDLWTPRRRAPDGPIKLLHIGEPALRKGGPLVLDVFTELFGDSDDVVLTIKSNGYTKLDSPLTNVQFINSPYTDEEMVDLVHRHDALIYPSWGEGFGLIPLQAMSTGMPVIINRGWAAYEHLIPDDLVVESHEVPSPWPQTHPGNMLEPDREDLSDAISHLVKYIDGYRGLSYLNSFDVHRDYDWDRLTESAFSHITV